MKEQILIYLCVMLLALNLWRRKHYKNQSLNLVVNTILLAIATVNIVSLLNAPVVNNEVEKLPDASNGLLDDERIWVGYCEDCEYLVVTEDEEEAIEHRENHLHQYTYYNIPKAGLADVLDEIIDEKEFKDYKLDYEGITEE